ncbi:WD40 repeat-like protein, partial [Mycena pura]
QVHPYANAAWIILTSVYQVVQNQREMDKQVADLVNAMVGLYSFVEDVQALPAKFGRFQHLLIEIAEKTVECGRFLEEYTQRDFTGTLPSNIHATNADKIKNLVNDLGRLKDSFDRELAIHAASGTTEILRTIKKSAAHLDNAAVLETLSYTRYDASARSECLAGTREGILRDIAEWLMASTDASNVLWLSGVAGSGKSTIATGIYRYFRDRNRLGAFVFFDRSLPREGSPKAVLHSIAHSLAQFSPPFNDALCRVLSDDRKIVEDTIASQFRKLLVEPLAVAAISGPIVVVLDALDECSNPTWLERLLELISHDFSVLTALRFLVTSRPVSVIAEAFRARSNITERRLRTDTSIEDIATYFRAYLPTVGDDRENIIQALTQRSDGLFIWAATACKLLQGYKPKAILGKLLADTYGSADALSSIYVVALRTAIPWGDESFSHDAVAVLGSILVARIPLTDDARDSLLGLEEGTSANVVKYLGCVIQRASDNTARLLHKSFGDYLTDPNRSGNDPWFINGTTHDHDLAVGCLRILNSRLQFNICRLENSHLLNKEVPDLAARIDSYIPATLRYASRYWADHLKGMGREEDILAALHAFMDERLLYWLEVVGLLDEVEETSHILKTALNYAEDSARELEGFLRDARRFVDGFGSVIAQSTPHIYLSALPFAPRNSLVRKKHSTKSRHVLVYSSPANSEWPSLQKVLPGGTGCVALSADGRRVVSGALDRTLRVWDTESGAAKGAPLAGHTERVIAVAFSANGRRIASASWDRTVRVWDMESDNAIGVPLTGCGQTDEITSVALSADGRRIVSGSSDCTVRIWDAESGSAIGALLMGHTDRVMSVALSADGRRVVSGSRDRTVRVWDAESGAALGAALAGHADNVTSVAISADGRRVVSGSQDHTVRVWDAESGAAIGAPLAGHTRSVTSVALSADGRQIVSGSSDQTVRVWDADSGTAIGLPLTGHTEAITAVALSADGRRVASASSDQTVCIWDAESGASSAPLAGHTEEVTSVALSADGRRIVSGSADMTVRIWDAESGTAAGALAGHTGRVTSVALSADGRRIASGSWDQTVRIWDAESGAPINTPLAGHTKDVTSVALSADGRRIVSGSWDGTVRIWDAECGTAIGAPLAGDTEDSEVISVALSADSRRIVSDASDWTVRIWDAESGAAIGTPLAGHTERVTSVALSADGRRIVSGSIDQTVCVWDAGTGTAIGAPLAGHTDEVTSVAVSSDGRRVVSGSLDGTVRVWDAESGAAVGAPLTGHTKDVTSVALSADGGRIVSGSSDRTIRIWAVELAPSQLTTSDALNTSFLANGWMFDPLSGSRIVWVPPWLRNHFCFPANSCVITPHGVTRLDMSNFVHGTGWETCFQDPRVDHSWS